MRLTIETVRTAGLGDSTHVVVHEGSAIVVDPQRDVDRFEKVLEGFDAELRLVLETHLHNDYVSGGRDLARRHGAELVVPAGTAPVFRHRPAFHREDIEVGELTIRPLHTPGHTPEHTSYVVLVGGNPEAVFSGGSLLVGSAGRSDLLGEARAETLAGLQYGSVNRLAGLPGTTGLYPTHGAGSFCTTVSASGHTSTIGAERATNPVLAHPDEESFVAAQLAGLVPFPSYYQHMGPLNLTGLPEPRYDIPLLEEVPTGVTVVDARPAERFASGHLPGALGIELRDSFGTWVGWLTEHNTPLVLVLDEDQDAEEALRQLARIGYDDVRGLVRPGPDHTARIEMGGPEELSSALDQGAQVVDVRAPDEWAGGVIEGSTLSYLPDLARETPRGLSRDRPVWLVCGTGFRATVAAGILAERGYQPVVLVGAGATEVARRASNN